MAFTGELEQFEGEFASTPGPSRAPNREQSTDREFAVKKRKVSRACDNCRKRKVRCDFIQLPTGNLNRCLNCFSFKAECTFSEGEVTKVKKSSQQRYAEALQEKVQRSEKLLELLCPDSTIREKLLSGEMEELPGEDSTSTRMKHPITAITDAGAVSPIDLTVAGIRVHVNRRGEDANESQDEEDLVDFKEFYNRLSLEDSEPEESFHVQKHYLGRSSGRHLQRTIAEMKKMHRHGFETNSNATAPPDNEIADNRRPVYWKISPWEMPLFRSRPIQRSLEIPDPALLDTLVGHYFKHVNIELPLLHRPTFERDIAQGLHRRDATFGAVVLLVCAMGSRYSDDPRVQLSDEDLFPDADGQPSDANPEAGEEMRHRRRPFLGAYSRGWKYFRRAWDFHESHPAFAPPTLYGLYFYCLAAQFLLQGTSSPQAAWLLIGIGIRLAQEVGAHRKRSLQGAVLEKDLLKVEELWKRACWVLITMDRLLTSATGRRGALDDEDFDLDLPLECDDEYWDDPDPELRFKQPEGKPSLITAFALTIRFNQILAVSMRTIYLVKPRVSKELLHEWQNRVVSEIDSALNKWLDEVPPHLRWGTEHSSEEFFVQSASLHSTYYYLQILVHRPFIPLPKKPSTTSFPSLAICTNAARKLIQIGLTFMERMKDVPAYMPFHILSAAVVLLLRIWESQKSGTLTEQQYRKDMEGVNSCLSIVQVAEQRSLSCGKLWDILNNLVLVNETYVRPNLEKKDKDAGRTQRGQESSSATALFPAPVHPPSPFTHPAVPLAAGPHTGLPLAGVRSGPQRSTPQHSSSDCAHNTAVGSGSSSSRFNDFFPMPGPLVDTDTHGMPSTSPAAPIHPGAAAPWWLAFAVPDETPQQSQPSPYLGSTTPFLEGIDNRHVQFTDQLVRGGLTPRPGPSVGPFDDRPHPNFYDSGLPQQGRTGPSESLGFPMFGQDGNWNFAPMMEEADISNTRYSSFWAESMSANIAPLNDRGSYLTGVASSIAGYDIDSQMAGPSNWQDSEENQEIFGEISAGSTPLPHSFDRSGVEVLQFIVPACRVSRNVIMWRLNFDRLRLNIVKAGRPFRRRVSITDHRSISWMTLKLAIVGGGPSAFYVASRLQKLLSTNPNFRVHVFDRLWSPHGLVRYGVAPDHPEVKNCTHKFDEAGTDTRFRFFGNVNVGDSLSPVDHTIQLPLSSIFSKYSHVVFATGCTLPKLHPDLPSSANCVPALSLVHWYTQHPNAPPTPPPLDKLSHVSIIGNGNVSLDVARMLLTGVDVLSKYDVPQSVLDVLAQSTVKHVSIIGRRGPLEAAFTMKELREMINLPEASMVPLDSDILQPPEGLALTRQQSRVLQLLSKGSKNTFGTTEKTWSLDFYRSPIGLQHNQLSLGHTMVDPKTQRAVPTGETSTIKTDLVVTSLGFHGEPSASYYDPGLGHLRTLNNRIITPHGHTLKHMYASGWASTGARGVLASTMMNAYDVAETIVNDYQNPSSDLITEQVLNAEPLLDEIPEEVQKGIEGRQVVQYPDWKRIDAEEIRRGEVLGKERERMHWDEARALLHHQA